ncbi:hypothetical protein BZG36_02054 [Bifiguratus adelaidae]|uniref:Uncharacterized protein n=1 Tax=Bifiguratus adelaidae TaxID=1938954 RepID=A0A261Y221_9FUNG|nr:hypothetical protein BZG36_02054 [Bifiguratus adelaidae]
MKWRALTIFLVGICFIYAISVLQDTTFPRPTLVYEDEDALFKQRRDKPSEIKISLVDKYLHLTVVWNQSSSSLSSQPKAASGVEGVVEHYRKPLKQYLGPNSGSRQGWQFVYADVLGGPITKTVQPASVPLDDEFTFHPFAGVLYQTLNDEFVEYFIRIYYDFSQFMEEEEQKTVEEGDGSLLRYQDIRLPGSTMVNSFFWCNHTLVYSRQPDAYRFRIALAHIEPLTQATDLGEQPPLLDIKAGTPGARVLRYQPLRNDNYEYDMIPLYSDRPDVLRLLTSEIFQTSEALFFNVTIWDNYTTPDGTTDGPNWVKRHQILYRYSYDYDSMDYMRFGDSMHLPPEKPRLARPKLTLASTPDAKTIVIPIKNVFVTLDYTRDLSLSKTEATSKTTLYLDPGTGEIIPELYLWSQDETIPTLDGGVDVDIRSVVLHENREMVAIITEHNDIIIYKRGEADIKPTVTEPPTMWQRLDKYFGIDEKDLEARMGSAKQYSESPELRDKVRSLQWKLRLALDGAMTAKPRQVMFVDVTDSNDTDSTMLLVVRNDGSVASYNLNSGYAQTDNSFISFVLAKYDMFIGMIVVIMVFLRWSALNQSDEESDEEGPREIQIEKCLQEYQRALRLQAKGNWDEAEELYEDLLEKDVLSEEIVDPKEGTGERSAHASLQYLVFKNYAGLLEERSKLDDTNVNADSLSRDAMKYYVKALNVDDTEYTTWHRLGLLALQKKNLRLARFAFECALKEPNEEAMSAAGQKFSADLKPIQWLSMEKLCNVLYTLGDYTACLELLDYTLQMLPGTVSAVNLKYAIEDRMTTSAVSGSRLGAMMNPSEDTMNKSFTEEITFIELSENSWSNFYSSLNTLYDRACTQLKKASLSNTETSFSSLLQRAEIVVSNYQVELPSYPYPPTNPEQDSWERSRQASQNMSIWSMINPVASVEKRRPSTDVDIIDEERLLRGMKRPRETSETTMQMRQMLGTAEREFLGTVTTAVRATGFDTFSGDAISDRSNYRAKPIFNFYNWFASKLDEISSPADDFLNPSGDSGSNRRGGGAKPLASKRNTKMLTFVLAPKAGPNEDPYEESYEVVNLAKNINAHRYGLLDCLFAYVIHWVKDDYNHSKWLHRWPEGIYDHVFRILYDEGSTLWEWMQANIVGDQSQPATDMICLPIAELLLDKLISQHIARITAQIAKVNQDLGSKRRGLKPPSRTLEKPPLDSEVDRVDSLLQFWMLKFQRSFGAPYLLALVMKACNDNAEDPQGLVRHLEQIVNGPYLTVLLRFCWLWARYHQLKQNLSQSLNTTRIMLKFLEFTPTHIHLVNCSYDATINPATVALRSQEMKIEKQMADMEVRIGEGDYERVYESLRHLIDSLNTSGSTIESAPAQAVSNLDLWHMLATACRQTNRIVDLLKCYGCMLQASILKLSSFDYINETDVANRPLHLEVIDVLRTVAQVLQDLLALLKEQTEGLAKDVVSVLLPPLSDLVQLAAIYLFQHPAFSVTTGAEAERYPDVDNGLLTIVSVRALCSLLVIIHSKREDVPKGDALMDKTDEHALRDSVQEPLLHLMSLVHQVFGRREICSADDGLLLHILRAQLKAFDGSFAEREKKQCLFCMYGYRFEPEQSILEEHEAKPSPLEEGDVELIFSMLIPVLYSKLDRGATLKQDVKDIFDQISEFYKELPEGDGQLQNNKSVIDSYLESQMRCTTVQDFQSDKWMPPLRSISRSNENAFSKVYYDVFYLKGKLAQVSARTRLRTHSEKIIEDCEEAAESFTLHLCFKPGDLKAWHALGVCYSAVADEGLAWSASNINDDKHNIANLQKGAYLALLQSTKLLRTAKSVDDSEVRDLWFDFGMLLYTMLSRPMEGLTFQTLPSVTLWNDDGERKQTQGPRPNDTELWCLGLLCFSRSLEVQRPEDMLWRSLMMLGKCFEKLRRRPQEAIALYIQAIKRVPPSPQSSEIVIDPLYQLYTSLLKHLHRKSITSQYVLEILDDRALKEALTGAFPKPDLTERQRQEAELLTETNGKVQQDDLDNGVARPEEESKQNDATMEIEPERLDDVLSMHKNQPKSDQATAPAQLEKQDQSPQQAAEDVQMDEPEALDEPEAAQQQEAFSEPIAKGDTSLHPLEMQAYDAIYEHIAQLRRHDKRKWYHRPIYKHAWMLYHIYNNAEAAKGQMLQLLSIRMTKQFVNFWKPQFERQVQPGRHFTCVEQYSRFLSTLLTETMDLDNSKMFCRRLRKSQNVILNFNDTWKTAYDGFMKVADKIAVECFPDLDIEQELRAITALFSSANDVEQAMLKMPKTRPAALLSDVQEVRKLNNRLAPNDQADAILSKLYLGLFKTMNDASPPTQKAEPEQAETTEADRDTTKHPPDQADDCEATARKVEPKESVSCSKADGSDDKNTVTPASIIARISKTWR